MNRRLAPASLALLLLVPAAAGCASSGDDTSTQPVAAPVSIDSTPDTSCTPLWQSDDGSGILVANGKVSGSMILSCDTPPTEDQPVAVVYSLEYIPAGFTNWLGETNTVYATWQQSYTTPAVNCHAGTWYIAVFLYGHKEIDGPKEQITDCTQDLS